MRNIYLYTYSSFPFLRIFLISPEFYPVLDTFFHHSDKPLTYHVSSLLSFIVRLCTVYRASE